jgi:predicted aspartyl protease
MAALARRVLHLDIAWRPSKNRCTRTPSETHPLTLPFVHRLNDFRRTPQYQDVSRRTKRVAAAPFLSVPRFRRATVVFGLLAPLLALVACQSGSGAKCEMTQVAQVPMELQGGLMTIPLGINGHWSRFVIDSGAERTTVSSEFAHQLNLPRATGAVTKTVGIGGATNTADVTIERLVIGGLQFPVNRIATGLFSLRNSRGLQADGLLGADILLAFDLDIDIPARKLTFYRSQACQPGEPFSNDPAFAIEGIRVSKDRMLVPLRLDGVVGLAVLDTGAENTVVGANLARQTGLTEEVLSYEPQLRMQGVGGVALARSHRFRQLEIGREQVRRPEILVLPSDLDIGDALLGGDFFRSRRIWLSFRHRQLFFAGRP